MCQLSSLTFYAIFQGLEKDNCFAKLFISEPLQVIQEHTVGPFQQSIFCLLLSPQTTQKNVVDSMLFQVEMSIIVPSGSDDLMSHSSRCQVLRGYFEQVRYYFLLADSSKVNLNL